MCIRDRRYTYNGRLIGNRIWPIKWQQRQWPRMTLTVIHRLQTFSNAICRTFVQHFMRFQLSVCSRGSSALAELLVLNTLRCPQYSSQFCCPGTLAAISAYLTDTCKMDWSCCIASNALYAIAGYVPVNAKISIIWFKANACLTRSSGFGLSVCLSPLTTLELTFSNRSDHICLLYTSDAADE